MYVKVQQDTLRLPLSKAVGVSVLNQAQILSHALISLDQGRLVVTGSDRQVEAVGSVAAEGRPGEVAVPARTLMDICRSLDDGAEIEIDAGDSEGGHVLVRCGKTRFRVLRMPATDFPHMQMQEKPEDVASLEISAALLHRMLAQAKYAMAKPDDVRHYLKGMLWELSPDRFSLAATDGHRLVWCHVAMELPVQETKSAIVPRKAIDEFDALLQPIADEKVSVTLDDQHIRMRTPQQQMTALLLDGKFPDYQRVIPKDRSKEVIVDRLSLIELLNSVAILSDDRYRSVNLSLSSGELCAKAKNRAEEEAEGSMGVDYQAEEPMSITFKIDYLLDTLKAIEQSQASIRLSNPESSCLISGHPADGDSSDGEQKERGIQSLCVVMPMLL